MRVRLPGASSSGASTFSRSVSSWSRPVPSSDDQQMTSHGCTSKARQIGASCFCRAPRLILVRLGGNHGERDAHLAEEEVHLLIVLGRFVADIHKAQDVAQFIGLLEVTCIILPQRSFSCLSTFAKP